MKFTGNTVDEAIESGLIKLKLTSKEVKVTVIEEEKKGLFGKVKSPAVVEITVIGEETTEEKTENKKTDKAQTEEFVAHKANKPEKKEDKNSNFDMAKGLENAKTFLGEVLNHLGYKSEITISNDGENDALILNAEKSSEIIGYRGEVLDALQTLAGAVANIGNRDYKKVVVDCESYRERREDTLIALAKKLEAKATEMRRDVWLEPMNPFERRIIHTALADSTTVTSKSEGKEPNRFVVIVPNDRDEFAKPYNAGRNNKDKKNEKHSRGGKGGKGNFAKSKGFGEKRKTSTLSFGTYLGNSLKDNK